MLLLITSIITVVVNVIVIIVIVVVIAVIIVIVIVVFIVGERRGHRGEVVGPHGCNLTVGEKSLGLSSA